MSRARNFSLAKKKNCKKIREKMFNKVAPAHPAEYRQAPMIICPEKAGVAWRRLASPGVVHVSTGKPLITEDWQADPTQREGVTPTYNKDSNKAPKYHTKHAQYHALPQGE